MADKIYEYYTDFLNTVDNSEYTDNSIIMYDVDFNRPHVIIHNWQNVKLADRSQIAAKANTFGWTDLTPDI